MKKHTLLPLFGAMILLILDSRCAAQSARDALVLCIQTLIPGLLPMFVISTMLVPHLSGIRIPGLNRLLGVPAGSEGFVLLGCAGGFPVGAACIVQAVESGGLHREEARRMLGISSFCGPAFLFGILGNLFSLREAGLLFLIQIQTAVVISMFYPSPSVRAIRMEHMPPMSLNAALKRACTSLISVCAWVTLAGVAAGFLRRWTGPLLPNLWSIILTGVMELTNGVFMLQSIGSTALRFVLCAGFVCFGGVSVLLQISGLAADSGISMTDCVIQKAVQGVLGTVLAAGTLSFGPLFLLTPLLVPAGKIAVEISGRMVYNVQRKEGI